MNPNYGHNWVWKEKALEIGCDGERCYSKEKVNLIIGKFEAVCPICGHIHYKHRMPKRKKSCGKCFNFFDKERLLVYFRVQGVYSGELTT